MLQFLFEAVALCVIGALFALIAIEAIVVAVNAVDVGFLLQVRPSRIIIALCRGGFGIDRWAGTGASCGRNGTRGGHAHHRMMIPA